MIDHELKIMLVSLYICTGFKIAHIKFHFFLNLETKCMPLSLPGKPCLSWPGFLPVRRHLSPEFLGFLLRQQPRSLCNQLLRDLFIGLVAGTFSHDPDPDLTICTQQPLDVLVTRCLTTGGKRRRKGRKKKKDQGCNEWGMTWADQGYATITSPYKTLSSTKRMPDRDWPECSSTAISPSHSF